MWLSTDPGAVRNFVLMTGWNAIWAKASCPTYCPHKQSCSNSPYFLAVAVGPYTIAGVTQWQFSVHMVRIIRCITEGPNSDIEHPDFDNLSEE